MGTAVNQWRKDSAMEIEIEAQNAAAMEAQQPPETLRPGQALPWHKWQHPTGGKPKRIAIVACGPSFAKWHAANMRYQPAIPGVDEVWAVNKGIRTLNCDLCFVLDDLIGEYRKAPDYICDVTRRSFTAGIPIIATGLDDGGAEFISGIEDQIISGLPDNASLSERSGFFEFPLFEILEYYGLAWHQARGIWQGGGAPVNINIADVRLAGQRFAYYLHNSIPMMLAYAGFIGVSEIVLAGVDYTFPGSDIREDDRPNAEYWIGYLRAMGIDVRPIDGTTILNTMKQPWCYGYARQPDMARGW